MSAFPVSEKRFPAFSQYLIALLCAGFAAAAVAEGSPDYEAGRKAYAEGDPVGAMGPLKRAAQAGDAAAQALLGDILDKAEFNEEAFGYLEKSAAQDNPDGLYGLAVMYLTGDAGKKDPPKAAELLRRGAAKGHMPSKLVLVQAYIDGNAELGADKRDSDEARSLLKESAEYGYIPAMEALSNAYRSGGFGLAADAGKADDWARQVIAKRKAASTRKK